MKLDLYIQGRFITTWRGAEYIGAMWKEAKKFCWAAGLQADLVDSATGEIKEHYSGNEEDLEYEL